MHLLDEEVKTYENAKPMLLAAHENEWVVIKGGEMLGTYPTLSEAYGKGLERWGYVPMLIKQIEREETPVIIPTIF